jgi:hypothetical protein
MSTLPETGDAQSFESAPLYGFLDPIPLSCLTRFRQKSSLTQVLFRNTIQTAFRDVAGVAGHCVARRKTPGHMRYRGGVDTMLNALNSDQDLFVAELSLAQDRPDELLSLVQIYRALGGGWQ